MRSGSCTPRKAWLNGLSPKENRDIPPLDYDIVYRLKASMPDVPIIINGGIASLGEAKQHLRFVDGVMLGTRGPIRSRGGCCQPIPNCSAMRRRTRP